MKQLILLLLALPFYSIAQPPAYVPSDSLVGWWGFNGNANDDSGNGNDGTVNGAILTSDRFGNSNSAFLYDGIDDLIDVGLLNVLEGANQISMSVWIRPDTLLINHNIITNRLVNQQSNYMQLKVGSYCSSTSAGMWIAGAGHNAGLSSGVFEDNTYHLVGVYNGDLNQITLYIDGIKKSTLLVNQNICSPSSIPSNSPSNGNNLKFGSGGSVTGYFKGVIDDIGIWNRALDSCEINDLYTSTFNSCNPTSIISTEKNSISIYPNPSSGITHISSDVSIGQIIIYDMMGKEIIRQSCNSNQVVLNINEFASNGTYLFKIEDLSGKIIHTQKLIYR